MKIDVCSDLHIHKSGGVRWEAVKNKDSEILIVAGDISDSVFMTANVLNKAAEHYDRVIAVMGNHDFYDFASPTNGVEVLRSLTSSSHRIVDVLGGRKVDTSVRLGQGKELVLVGDTAWYDWKSHVDLGTSVEKAKEMWETYMNDPRHVDFEGHLPDHFARIQARNIKRAIADADGTSACSDIIVVTHMIPRQDLTYEHPTNMIWNALTPSYVNTELSDLSDVNTNGKVKYHIYGHTHMRGMKEINGITYLNNALGMRDEQNGWFMVQIEV